MTCPDCKNQLGKYVLPVKRGDGATKIEKRCPACGYFKFLRWSLKNPLTPAHRALHTRWLTHPDQQPEVTQFDNLADARKALDASLSEEGVG